MRNQMIKRMLALSVAGAVAAASPAFVYAAEPGSVTSAGGETVDFTLILKDGEIKVKNETVDIVSAELAEAGNSEGKNPAETEGDAEAAEIIWNLVLTESDGSLHIFENVVPLQWTDPVLVREFEWLYIEYQDENGKTREAAETAEEKVFEEPVSAWVTTGVNIREEASADSEILLVSAVGMELQAVGSASGWVKVQSDDITGYINHHYLTEDQDVANAAVEAENNARQAAEAAAAAAQAAAQAQQKKKSSGKTVVSRQAYDDCDGSGHGYYEIVYSDGSVAYEDY